MSPRLVNITRLVWLLVVFWYELGTFYNHASSCQWPDVSQSQLELSNGSPTHVLVVADPQILDHRSYPDRPPWLVWLSQVIVDLNLRKSWRAVLRCRPDAVVFLGDMMDNGRHAMSDEEYETYFRRFKSIFAADASIPMHYLPGNHDVGLGVSSPRYQFDEHAVERYTSHFGALNQRITLANRTVWLIDAPGMVDEDRERAIAEMPFAQWAEAKPDRTIAFVQSSAQSADPEHAVDGARPILFTHVPLYRPERTDCGPLRERGTIRQGRGLGYQNLLSQSASQFLLQTIRPAIVFSGDDHDYCEYVHTVLSTDTKRPTPPTSIPEITVKSFSMAMGVRRPGYQLLSLIPPTGSHPTSSHQDEDRFVAHRPCLLPDQLGIYLSVYVPLIVLTLIVLLGSNIRRTSQRYAPVSTRSGDSIPLGSRSNPDDDVDYDLPPPSAWRSKAFPRQEWSWSFTLPIGGNRRRITLSLASLRHALVAFFWSGSGGDDERDRRVGVMKGFWRDFWEAAWAPLALFVVIGWSVW